MIWFKKISQYRNPVRYEISPDGVISILGNTFPIKQQLSQLGFRWDGQKWNKNYQSLLSNPSALTTLKTLGININTLSPPTQTQPSRFPVPQNTNWLSNRLWYLANRKSDNKLVVLRKDENTNWEWISEDGETGVSLANEVADFAQSIKEDGQLVFGVDPRDVILDYKQKNSTTNNSRSIPPDQISEHQKQIENTFVGTNKSIMMNALAGSGKTTMLKHLSSFKKPNEKWLYLVFNKKNQVEGKQKFPKDVEVLTSHSFLGRVLSKNSELNVIPSTDIWTQGGERISQILDHVMESDNTFPRQFKFAAKKIIKSLASLGKAYAISPTDPTAPDDLRKIIEQYQIDCDLSTERQTSNNDWTPQIIDKALDIMHYCLPGNSTTSEFQHFRDHDDTLWYAATNNDIKWPKYDVVLADEVQDFNRCQMIMLKKLADAGARVVCVGDPNQSIYLFRGSDAHAFSNIQKLVTNLPSGGAEHELPVNYRSGKAIIDYVNRNTKVKNLKAGLQHEGKVTEGTLYGDSISNLYNEYKTSQKLAQTTAYIGRTNAPLVTCALDLMKSDIDFVILGRDFSSELVGHIERVLGKGRFQQNIPIARFIDKLQDFQADVEQKWQGKISKAPELKHIKDVTQSLEEIVRFLQAKNFRDNRVNIVVRDSVSFIEYLKRRFSGVNIDTEQGASQYASRDPKSFVTITSAHRSKGLEFDRVFVVRNDLFPHPNAKTPEALEQEENAKYVCYTRAMNELHILVHPNEVPNG